MSVACARYSCTNAKSASRLALGAAPACFITTARSSASDMGGAASVANIVAALSVSQFPTFGAVAMMRRLGDMWHTWPLTNWLDTGTSASVVRRVPSHSSISRSCVRRERLSSVEPSTSAPARCTSEPRSAADVSGAGCQTVAPSGVVARRINSSVPLMSFQSHIVSTGYPNKAPNK